MRDRRTALLMPAEGAATAAVAAESSADRAAAVVLIAAVRWSGVLLGTLQALLVSDPKPVGGSLAVLAATLVMAAYNVPATLARRFSPVTVERLRWGCLAGDFVVCSAWTMLVANDVFSTTYATYILVGIEAAFLYGMRGAGGFSLAFLGAYAVLYWERAHYFGFPVLISSLIFRSTIVLVSAAFSAAIAEQSERRRSEAVQASAEARHHAEATEQRTEQLDSLLRAISDIGEGVVSVNDGHIVYANDAFTNLTGYDIDELRELGVGAVIDPAEPESDPAGAADDPTNAYSERMVIAKNGERIPIEWASRYVETGSGALLIGVVRDIRERKRNLELLEAERDRAEEASQAKSDYLSRMSHELRTPMSAILGFTELLEMRDREEDRDAIRTILAAGNHLHSLINDVLDISRIEAGEQRPELEPVSIAAAFDECVGLMRPLADAQRTTLRTSISGVGAGHVQADRQRLLQLLLNLVSNAVKYSGAESSVMIGARPAHGNRVRLSVTDDGPGIRADLVSRVFEPFDRLGAERSMIAGTGLGLTLAKRLAESMDGTIGVVTAPGSGSMFWVELPVAEAPEARERTHDDVRREGLRDSGAATVLYVEDNLTTISLMQRIFEHRPAVTLVTALQGSIAIDLAREHAPDLIFLDLHLPDINGDEVLRRLKKDVRTKGIPVIVVSADATTQQVDRLLAAGAERYLTKPVHVGTVLEVVDDTVARRRSDALSGRSRAGRP